MTILLIYAMWLKSAEPNIILTESEHQQFQFITFILFSAALFHSGGAETRPECASSLQILNELLVLIFEPPTSTFYIPNIQVHNEVVGVS